MKKYSLTILCSILFWMVSSAQQTIVRTPDGKTIILNPDGTWVYSNNTTYSPPENCATTLTGEIRLINSSSSSISGRITFGIWREGPGKGGTTTDARDFFLKPGESMFIGEVYQGNVEVKAQREIPDPDNIGKMKWEYNMSISRNEYVRRCELKEIKIQ